MWPSFGSPPSLPSLCWHLQLHWSSDTLFVLQCDTAKVITFWILEKQNELWNVFVSLWVLEIWRPYLEQETQTWSVFSGWCIGHDSALIRGFKVFKADPCCSGWAFHRNNSQHQCQTLCLFVKETVFSGSPHHISHWRTAVECRNSHRIYSSEMKSEPYTNKMSYSWCIQDRACVILKDMREKYSYLS